MKDNKYPLIEIKSKGEAPTIFTEIYVDGHKLRGVRRFELKQEVGNSIPTLTVDLNALNLSTDVQTVLYQYGMSGISDISFEKDPTKDYIFSKMSELYGIDEEEARTKVYSEWNKENPSYNHEG